MLNFPNVEAQLSHRTPEGFRQSIGTGHDRVGREYSS